MTIVRAVSSEDFLSGPLEAGQFLPMTGPKDSLEDDGRRGESISNCESGQDTHSLSGG
jgi:hypothetical protein